MMNTNIKMCHAAHYCLKVRGSISKEWLNYHDNMIVEEVVEDGKRPLTILTGEVIDQAALMGFLNHLYNLQLPIISVEGSATSPSS